VGWRNYASSSNTGTFPGYTIPGRGTNYAISVLQNTNGFLSVATNTSGGATDRQFPSRQQLISFLTSVDSSAAAQSNAINALRYLSTFTRGLDQPSYVPATNRPTTLTIANGGNNISGGDNTINISFQTNRVPSAFTRNDGSTARIGEPIVNKRFALNRLAWLTYKGPSASLYASNPSDPVILAMMSNGISLSTITNGTPAKISSYFGLTWNAAGTTNAWTYRLNSNHPICTIGGGTYPVGTVANPRDPDFFELLKAAVTAGSLGKAYSYKNTATNVVSPEDPNDYNQQKDNSLDAQIMQIGANIIAQSSPDGYSPRIRFNDGILFGGVTMEYRGVKDLPYIYRVRESKIMTQDSSPSQGTIPRWDTTNIVNPGSGTYQLIPEIWNPHMLATNANTANIPSPTNFKLVAITTNPLVADPYLGGGQSFTLATKYLALLVTYTGPSSTVTLGGASPYLTFSIPSTRKDLFREPTLLFINNRPAGSSLALSSGSISLGGGMTTPYQMGMVGVTNGNNFVGIPLASNIPMAFNAMIAQGKAFNNTPTPLPTSSTNAIVPTGYVDYVGNVPAITYRLMYQDVSGNWVTYDEKYALAPVANQFEPVYATNTGVSYATDPFQLTKTFYIAGNNTPENKWSECALSAGFVMTAFDPRSSRFGMQAAGSFGRTMVANNTPLQGSYGVGGGSPNIGWPRSYLFDNRCTWSYYGWATASVPAGNSINTSLSNSAMNSAAITIRPDIAQGGSFLGTNTVGNNSGYYTAPTASGWAAPLVGNIAGNKQIMPGLTVQNNPANISYTSTQKYTNDINGIDSGPPQYYVDPDGVVRRAMAGWVPYSGGAFPADRASGTYPSGIPLSTAYQFGTAALSGPINNQNLNRPFILNRPFRNVGELGYVFTGTPWRNVDFSTPESGYAALLDVFCVNETTDSMGMVAGKVDLNTRQSNVISSILIGSYKDEYNNANTLVNGLVSSNLASVVAGALKTRTTTNPLPNLADLVGRWKGGAAALANGGTNGSLYYAGFASDASSSALDNLASVITNATYSSFTSDPELRIQRFREASIRALAASGQTRVWNLMVDIIVQTGKFPQSVSGLNGFMVDGEARYWVHLAIDRLTGQVIDKQVEVVKE
jgi:hypothetical protein